MAPIKIYLKNLAMIFLLTALCASCSGSASAPPVDLPAPITGRITISSPDSSGNVTITGTAGAVDAGAMVMAVNEEVAGTVSIMILNMLVTPAYAQTVYPSVCDEAGHACAVADDDGAFEMSLAASLGDSIVIGVIDENSGEFVSDLLRRTVGEEDPDANCENEDVDAVMVDIEIDHATGNPIILKQGNAAGTNQLVIGGDNPISKSIGGCFANSLETKSLSDGTTRVAVSSKNDKLVWTAILSGTEISSSNSFSIDYNPLKIVFKPGSTTEAIIVIEYIDSIALAHISLEYGSLSNITQIAKTTSSSSEPIDGLTQSLAMDFASFSDSSVSLGLIVTNDDADSGGYLTLFLPGDLTMINTWSKTQLNQVSGLSSLTQIADADFIYDSNTNLNIVLLDNESQMIYLTLPHNDELAPLATYTDGLNLGSYPDIYIFYGTTYSVSAVGTFYTPLRLAVKNPYPADSNQMLFCLTTNGSIWGHTILEETYSADVVYNAYDTLIDIAIDDALQKAFVADQTANRAVSISEFLGW